MAYTNTKYKKTFVSKKTIHSFRDLEVYQKTMECSVLIVKDLSPILAKLNYNFLTDMISCSMAIPLWIGESHSVRYGDFVAGVGLLEKAMANCNKMVIYLEQIKGVYGSKMNIELLDDIIGRYVAVRVKMFRLEKSWRRYREIDSVEKGKEEKIKNFKY
ncbi:MAG: hypothetical protein NT077_00305 [Candidatus Taylorbacteria bacterium]|nr:hypothetical protein [Candidatus Taylorbacteria bacterium]